MHGPEEWRSRPGLREEVGVHRIRPIGLLHTFPEGRLPPAAAAGRVGACDRLTSINADAPGFGTVNADVGHVVILRAPGSSPGTGARCRTVGHS
jgi:hypothetical protein